MAEPTTVLTAAQFQSFLNRACPNPAHLEAVTGRENLLRGETQARTNRDKTHCQHGHEFTPENTYHPPHAPWRRNCRTCIREASARHKRRRRQQERANGRLGAERAVDEGNRQVVPGRRSPGAGSIRVD